MQQTAISSLLLLAALMVGCRKDSPQQVAPQTPEPSQTEILEGAFDRAIDVVESSHIKAAPVTPLPPDVIRGAALPLYAEFPGLSYEAMLDRMPAIGITHVSIIPTWEQDTIFDNRIVPRTHSAPTDSRLREIIAHAHKVGLKVMVFPILHINRRSDGEWRGRLAPTQLARWQQEYRTFILHYANLCAELDVELFSVGSELSSMERYNDFWLALIRDVRQTYSGKLIYSSNWDHYVHPGFWHALDFVGVSAYFEVSTSVSEPIHKVTNTWRLKRDELLSFAQNQQRPLVLTEVGYPSIHSAGVKPWDYTSKTPPNPNQQLAAFRSLVDSWNQPPDAFGGVFVWHGWGHGGRDDTSYAFWGKPSERLLKTWFSSADRDTNQ